MVENKSKIYFCIADDCVFTRMMFLSSVVCFEELEILYMCENGQELIDLLERTKTKPSFCIIDLHMPIIDGSKTIQTIRKKFPEIKLFGYTSSKNSVEVQDLYSKGADLVISKCESPIIVLKKIVELL